jgi:hypothetical protein
MSVIRKLPVFALSFGLFGFAGFAADDYAARSTLVILQQDETLPTAPQANDEIEPSPSDIPSARKPAVISEPVVPPQLMSDMAKPPIPSVADLLKDSSGCDGCFACRTRASRCPDDPWKLPQPCFLQNMGINVGGWLQHGITYNDRNPASGFNGPVATNDLDSEWQMNQLWLYLVRPADTGGCGFAWGGRVDMVYGTDWRFGVNYGLEDRINGLNDQRYGLVLPQFYLELAYNDVSVKLGHFAAILDYEVIPAPGNPFYSHSYSYGYTVPMLVTGALADWKMTDQWSVQAGLHRGWMMFEDANDDWDVMAGVKWTSLDERTSVAYALSSGRQSFLPVVDANNDNRFVYSLVLQRQMTERLRYVLVHNLGYETGFPLPTGERIDAQWYGLNQYLLYRINPRLNANLRAEWMRDDDGARIAGPGNIDGISAWDGAGYAGNFYGLTAGLNWRPRANLLFRPEIRYDWYEGEDSWTGEDRRLRPFGNGNRDDQLTLGIDMVITY